jgi:hypothetical protein
MKMKLFPLARMMVPSLILIASSFVAQTAGAQAPAAAPTTCKDGSTSTATGRGACSGHGGVQKATAGSSGTSSSGSPTASTSSSSSAASTPPASGTAMKAAAPATPTASGTSSSPKSTTGNTDPTGATAKCKDGTYSKAKTHSGACSKHGGVDQWMDGSK